MKIALLAAAAATVLSASAALAAPISFVFTGTGTGTLNGSPFGPSAFTVTLLGDTDDRIAVRPTVWQTPADSASIAIGGLGTYSFTTPLRVYSNTNTGVGFSRQSNGWDLYQLDAPRGWDMLSSISSTASGTLTTWNATPMVETSGGTLIFDFRSGPGAAFTASLVPEPSALALVGLAGAVLRRRRHR